MSKIEWLQRPGTKAEVWNPVTGCTKVSEGCRHCYAERFANRRMAPEWRDVADNLIEDPKSQHPSGLRLREFTDVQCHDDRLTLPLRWKQPRTVFVNSMSDLFHDAVPDAFIDRVFAVMQAAKSHTFIVLTKRPKRMHAYLSSEGRPHSVDDAQLVNLNAPGFPLDGVPCLVQEHLGRVDGWPLPNVWLGVSIEDQRTADERIPRLLQTPAAVRVVSAEPLLGPVDASRYLRQNTKFHLSASVPGMLANKSFYYLQDDSGRPLSPKEAEAELRALLADGVERIPCSGECASFDKRAGCPGHQQIRLDWLILGGESGPQSRPCDAAWIRALKDQAAAAGVPCFVKQLGANPVDPTEDGRYDTWGPVHDRKGGDPSEWPDDLRVREWPEVAP